MKNVDELKAALQELDSPEGGESELKSLRDQLRAIAREERPSDIEQRWAWTRMEARLSVPRANSHHLLPIRLVGWGALALLVLGLGLSMQSPHMPVRLPEITETRPGYSAVAFYSPEASAQVIWVDGYEYLPGHKSLK